MLWKTWVWINLWKLFLSSLLCLNRWKMFLFRIEYYETVLALLWLIYLTITNSVSFCNFLVYFEKKKHCINRHCLAQFNLFKLWLTQCRFLFCCRMKCLLCSLHFIRETVLKKHYVDYHFINEDDIFFKDLFLPDAINKTCRICKETFKS